MEWRKVLERDRWSVEFFWTINQQIGQNRTKSDSFGHFYQRLLANAFSILKCPKSPKRSQIWRVRIGTYKVAVKRLRWANLSSGGCNVPYDPRF